MEYKGINTDRLNTIQREQYHCTEPVKIEQEYVMATLKNDDIVERVDGVLEKMRLKMLENAEMSIVVEMAKAYLDIMTPREVLHYANGIGECRVCRKKFMVDGDFCPYCGHRVIW